MALTLGSTGDEVRRKQQALRDLGYDIEVDGIYGPKTLAADNLEGRGSGGPRGGSDKLLDALTRARQQAQGAGIDASRVDPAYAALQATGKTQGYTDAALLAGRPATFAQTQSAPSYEAPQSPARRPTLTLAEALSRARGTLRPVYEQDVADLTQRIGYDLVRRGGYGQPDSPEIVAKGIAPTQAAYMSNVQRLAQSLMEADMQAASQEYSQDLSKWQAEKNVALSLDEARRRAAENEAQRRFEREKYMASLGLDKERFGWEKGFKEKQFGAEYGFKEKQLATEAGLRSRQLDIDAGSKAKNQYVSGLYSKIMSGQPLTDTEKRVLGIDTDDLYKAAVGAAQKDPGWFAADDAAKDTIIDYYLRLFTGQKEKPAKKADEDIWRSEGLMK